MSKPPDNNVDEDDNCFAYTPPASEEELARLRDPQRILDALEEFRRWMAADINFAIDDEDPTTVLTIAKSRIERLGGDF